MDITLDDLNLTDDDLKDVVKKPIPLADNRPRWHAQARVLVVEHTHCACGMEYISPAAKDLLVRFVNVVNFDVQELSDHPAVENPDLPLATRSLVSRVNICPRCAL